MKTVVRIAVEHPDDVNAWDCIHELIGRDPRNATWHVQTERADDGSYRVRPFKVAQAWIVSTDQEAST